MLACLRSLVYLHGADSANCQLPSNLPNVEHFVGFEQVTRKLSLFRLMVGGASPKAERALPRPARKENSQWVGQGSAQELGTSFLE